jgi:hypothetical protein
MVGGIVRATESYNESRVGRRYPASRLRIDVERGGPVAYGTWLIGNDYRNKTRYYGAYPAGYLERVAALFPEETDASDVLHVFSGSLPRGNYCRCDVNPANGAELQCDVLQLPRQVTHAGWRLVIADPPYTSADAARYGTPMVNRGKVFRALAGVTVRGGHVVWLDTVWPMHSKTEWRTVGRIALIRSTNHRIRLVSIFERISGV